MNVLRVSSIAFGTLCLVLGLGGRLPFPALLRQKRWVALFGVGLILLGAVDWYVPAQMVKRTYHIVKGDLLDVGGYRLRMECRGSGEPTVIMDAGLGQHRHTWGTVPYQVSGFTRVCTYDRANLGDSDADPHPRTSRRMVQELEQLLEKARVQGPFVLVGHSFGGVNMRLFAAEHPEWVRGIVLVDASQEDEISEFLKIMDPREKSEYFIEESGYNAENANVIASMDELRGARLDPSTYVTVITAQSDDGQFQPGARRLWGKLQFQLSLLVPRSKQIIVEPSGHFVQLDHPDMVTHAIREMVDALR